MGKVFTRLGESGHLFCQHYLDPMFGEHATFLGEEVVVEEGVVVGRAADVDGVEGVRHGERQVARARGKTVRELSRLWWYKDGRVPPPVEA